MAEHFSLIKGRKGPLVLLIFFENFIPKGASCWPWNHPWPDIARFLVLWASQYDAHGACAIFSVYSFACQLDGFTFVKILVSTGS